MAKKTEGHIGIYFKEGKKGGFDITMSVEVNEQIYLTDPSELPLDFKALLGHIVSMTQEKNTSQSQSEGQHEEKEEKTEMTIMDFLKEADESTTNTIDEVTNG